MIDDTDQAGLSSHGSAVKSELLYRIGRSSCPPNAISVHPEGVLEHMAKRRGHGARMITVLDPSRDLARVDVAHGLSASKRRAVVISWAKRDRSSASSRRAAIVPSIGDEPLFLDRTASRANLDRSKILPVRAHQPSQRDYRHAQRRPHRRQHAKSRR